MLLTTSQPHANFRFLLDSLDRCPNTSETILFVVYAICTRKRKGEHCQQIELFMSGRTQASASRSICRQTLLACALAALLNAGHCLALSHCCASSLSQTRFASLNLGPAGFTGLQSQGNALSILRKHKACSLSVVGQLDRARPSPSCASA